MSKQSKKQIPNSNQIQKCIFCGQLPLTREHFWPSWMKDVMPKSKYNHHLRVEGDVRNQIKDFSQGKQKKISGPPNSWQLKVVCSSCNNGWMSQIETEAKPIIEALAFGREIELGKNEQAILSKWAFLKITIGEFNEAPERIIRREERHYFYKYKAVPPEWKIWIAKLNPAIWHYLYYQSSGLMNYTDNSTGREFTHKSKYGLFVLGEMVLYVGKFSFNELVSSNFQIEYFIIGEHATRVHRIYPKLAGRIDWKTIDSISYQELLMLNDNLRAFSEALVAANRHIR